MDDFFCRFARCRSDSAIETSEVATKQVFARMAGLKRALSAAERPPWARGGLTPRVPLQTFLDYASLCR